MWAHVEAKRRAVQALYFLYWAYSVHHGSRHFNCLEIGRMLAPGPRFLWQAADEAAWRALYVKWLAQWEEEEGDDVGLLVHPSLDQGLTASAVRRRSALGISIISEGASEDDREW